MKLKIIVSILITAAISSQAYAMQITKGKLISHKEWATKGAKASYATGTKTRQSIMHDEDGKVLPSMTASEAHSTFATIGNPVSVKNDGFIYLFNKTDQTREYNVGIQVCADSDVSGNTECVHYWDRVSLEPAGYYFDSIAPTLTMIYNTPGTYSLSASTYFQNSSPHEDSSWEESSSYSDASIIVS